MKTARYLISTLSVCAALSSGTALAQSLDPSATVFERARPDYDAKGLPVGSFRAKPTLNVSETYNDNIYAANTAEQEDYITHVRPGIALESDWNRHALNLRADGDFSFYQDNDDENTENYGVGADTRLDVMRDTFVTGGASYDLRHEDRGDPNNTSTSVEPAEYSETAARAGIFRGLRRVSAKLDGEYTQLDYEKGRTASGTAINNDGRDRDVYKGTLRLGYEFLPDYEAFVRGTLNSRDYDNAQDAGGRNRDSEGYDVVAGTAISLSGKTRGEVYAGYMEQDYDDASLQTVDGASYGANLIWNATALTSVIANVDRSIEETTSSNASAYINTSYGLSVEHELMRNVLLGADVRLSQHEYEGGTSTREDDYLNAGLEAKYLLSRNADLSARYGYTDRDSNVADQDYTANTAMLGVGLAF